MTLLGYLLVLTGVVCCTAAPASDTERPPDSCGPPQRFQDKELQGDWNKQFYPAGTEAQYSCRPGYIRLGAIRYACVKGKWETLGSAVGQCKKKSCGHPGDIEYGTFELTKEDSFVFGAVVEYFCNDGYQMISKHRTRECTATGWSNYRPECEVRFCPPVQVGSNVNLLTTSYEEEYSVGQVIRFECKNANQKLNGASEIFCTSEGEWNAPPPTCEEVKCIPPTIIHGGVSNAKTSYKDKETLTFSCEKGYKPSTTGLLTCTKNDWSPTPICEDIICYQENVVNGIVQYTKDTYRDGETITLTCKEGYEIDHKPEEPRTCTAQGWSPPLKCVNKKCIQPNPQNGYTKDPYRFPISPDAYYNWIYYYCDPGFLSPDRTYYGTTTCTKTGWNPEPKCYKKCDAPTSDSINGIISYTTRSRIFIEGDKLRFQCNKDHKTSNGQISGEIECLPDGKFYGEKCSKSCQKPDLANMEYKTNENVFDVGAFFIYKCKDGFISSDNKFEGASECGKDGWQPKPECKGIFCKLTETVGYQSKEKPVPFGKVVYFKCPKNWTLEGPSSIQCSHYGWSSSSPICRDEKNEESTLPSLHFTKLKDSKCPSLSALPNARLIKPKAEYFNGEEIEIECDPGYQLFGSEKGLCKDWKWQSIPRCIEKKKCTNPPQITNGKISAQSASKQYYSGSTVKYICEDGYQIIDSDESKCIDGKWLPPPTCEGNPCGKPKEILNGVAEDGRREYKHRERAAYVCDEGYRLSESEPASCDHGKWSGVPQCIDSSCRQPPTISNGVLKEQKKATYLSGERVIYECSNGYTMGQNANYITCENSVWTELPECRKFGQTCGEPPVVPLGDITEMKQKSYRSGSSVTYKCANYHKLEGEEVVTCRDGEWEKKPVCRVPCTVKEAVMQQNNIELRYKYGEEKKKKIYSVHSDWMSFECKSGYEIFDEKTLRIQCLDGVLKYPKCLKEGSCVLQQAEMANNNIHYNKSTEIENGQTIQFECVEGMVSENDLQTTCRNRQIKYPKCSAGRSCSPPVISNAIHSSEKQDGYESGSSVNIKCKDTFVLSGRINVKCENGKWDELPQCLQPCTIDRSSLEINHIELLPTENAPEILEHGTELNVKCKANFKRPGSLTALCSDGVMKYSRCFSGGTCRIIQNDLDENFLELDESHENEVFYEEGETVSFKCKTGYRKSSGLTGTCTKSEKPAEYTLTYPTCRESAV
ncbi:complement factor H-like isoform X2 [Lithobates pipiens]